jgi:hypothetical protein
MSIVSFVFLTDMLLSLASREEGEYASGPEAHMMDGQKLCRLVTITSPLSDASRNPATVVRLSEWCNSMH